MHTSRWLRALALVLALVLTASCTGDGSSPSPTQTPTASPPADNAPRKPDAARMHAIAQRIMDRRERAVLTKDKSSFLADLDPSNRPLRDRQARLFENLTRLPLRTFELDAVETTWPAGFADKRWAATAYIPYVEQQLQLRGFDPMPVTTVYGITFARTKGRWRIVSDDDVADREASGARDAPWDLTRIVVHRSRHVLGIFDEVSAESSDQLMAWTEDSVRTVRAAVPVKWRNDVVVYALSRDSVLRLMGTRFLDRAAVAFHVPDNNEDPTRRVSTRVVMNPKYLPRNEFQGTYLLSHEITHVALSRTGNHTPAWVQEGLAEYVATHGASPSRWYIAPSSVRVADRGVDAMPGSTFFGDKRSAFDYDLSLAACAYLASEFGERRLWDFLARMALAGSRTGDPEVAQDQVLTRMFDLDSRALAHRAARLIVERAG